MERDELLAIADLSLWVQMLEEAEPDVPGAVEAAYFETTKQEEDRLYEGRAILLVGKTLRLYSLTSAGSRHNDQVETIERRVVPFSCIESVNSVLNREGWGRGVDARSIKAKSLAASIVFRDQTEQDGKTNLPFTGDADTPGDLERIQVFVGQLNKRLAE